MADISLKFSEITAILEDMHGVAIEGQATDFPSDLQIIIASSLRLGAVRLENLISAIEKNDE